MFITGTFDPWTKSLGLVIKNYPLLLTLPGIWFPYKTELCS